MQAILRATALCGALILSGCGIKGPLTLPPPPTPTKASPATKVDHNKAPLSPNESPSESK
ncbi:lipoprotein [Azoarcus sp. KH32C]|uniref:LPS translocon maturation chaperone LptM n=1 Tax=Azoarcus sp. KH32C TaxID=748247 RepID=UPI001E47570D|nr:lipoprotein [Azoarcus sp. KH32C]